MSRDPSPADTRCNLHPDHVDAMADTLHAYRCIPLGGHDPFTGQPTHRAGDLAAARVLLMTLRDDHHLHLTPTTRP